MKSTKTTSADGTIEYRNANGKRHRIDGPAIIRPDGTQSWWLGDKIHRAGGPAIIYADGEQAWYVNGQLHREDGPAYIDADGSQWWCLIGEYHRTDGPAYIGADGTLEWWVSNIRYFSTKDFQRATGTSDEDMSVLILKYGEIS